MMQPLVIGDHVWGVIRVSPGDPLLVDRTGTRRVATTDPANRVIRISEEVMPPLYDRVLLHEAAHATMVEHGVTDLLSQLPTAWRIATEELLAWFLETHGLEVVDAVSASLGRGVCVDGICLA